MNLEVRKENYIFIFNNFNWYLVFFVIIELIMQYQYYL